MSESILDKFNVNLQARRLGQKEFAERKRETLAILRAIEKAINRRDFSYVGLVDLNRAHEWLSRVHELLTDPKFNNKEQGR